MDVLQPLREGLAALTGGRDRRGGPVLTLAAPRQERAAHRPEEYHRIIQYLMGVPR